MKDFVTFKEEIVSRCKAKGACMGEFQKLLAAENEYDLWLVLFSNYTWCDSRSIFTKDERIKKFVFPETVNGSLNLNGCDLKGITLPKTVGGYLHINNCDLTNITLPVNIGGFIELRYCNLKGITLPKTVGGYLSFSGCDLTNITFPKTVGGNIYLFGCNIPDTDQFRNFKNIIIK